MKNILFKILPLVAAVLFATSCSKDEGSDLDTIPNSTTTNSNTDIPVQAATESFEEPSMPFTIEVCQDESLSKKGVKEDGTTLTQFFNTLDEIEVTGEEIHGTLTMGDDGYLHNGSSTAYFSGTLYGNGVLKYEAGEDMELHYSLGGAKLQEPIQLATGSDLDKAFSACGYLTATETRNKNSTTRVYLKQQTAFLRFTSEFSTSVNIQVPGSSEYTTFYIPGIGTHIIAVPDGSKVNASFLSTEKTIDVSSGTVVYNITRSLPNSDCIPAAFSISANEQVLFSKSNLLYGISMDHFENNHDQWDIGSFTTNNYDVGTDYANAGGSGYNGLFGWGTWVDDHYGSTTPISTSTNNSAYWWTTNDHFGNTEPRAPAAGFVDQGWFSLTSDEWDYLLNQRKMADGVPRYFRASIKKSDGTMIPGLILVPDGNTNIDEAMLKNAFTGNHIFAGCASDSYTADSFDNYIVEEDWETLFADLWCGDKGLVFLPAAGYRDGTKIYNDESQRKSYYWTSSMDAVEISNTNVKTGRLIPNYQGCSVRLVHAMPTTKPTSK